VTSPVRGVSFRQDEVGQLVEGMPLRLVHEPEHPYDSNAMAVVRADTGRTLGYLPAKVAPHVLSMGTHFGGEVAVVRRGEIWGFDVLITNLLDVPDEAPASPHSPAPLHIPVAEVAAMARAGAVELRNSKPTAQESGDGTRVRSRSGRDLGELVCVDEDRVRVLAAGGVERTYPRGLVDIH
jgi:hypothetical protein